MKCFLADARANFPAVALEPDAPGLDKIGHGGYGFTIVTAVIAHDLN